MSGTYRASLSIRLREPVADGSGRQISSQDRWARVDLEDHFWLGRCSICNLVFQGDQSVSRLHATIQREGDRYRFTDMQSMNGSYVNGREVKSCVLKPGDAIYMGSTEIAFDPQRPHDTVFQDGSSRITGQTMITLRSFPCTLSGSIEGRPPEMQEGQQGRAVDQPTLHSRMDIPVTAVQAGEGAEPPAVAAPPPPRNEVPPLEAFLTIVIDRVVSELKAQLGVIYVPAVNGFPAVALARGWVEGRLGVLMVPPDLVARVEKHLPVVSLQADGGYEEIGTILQWREELMHQRIKPGDRFPVHAGSGWEVTVPLPRVGRVNTDLKPVRTLDGLAWIHVALETLSPQSSYPRVVEVAGGVSASIVRYIDRGRG